MSEKKKERVTVNSIVNKPKEALEKVKESTINVIDQNGDGEIVIDDVIIAAIKTPGIRVNRTAFLKRELYKHYDEDVVELAIAKNPADAGG